jgi:hypothetical protein
MLTPEEIEQNWRKFTSLCEKTGDRAPAIAKMLEDLDERLCLCPASSKASFHNAFPGGLVKHSLHVLNNVIVLNKAYEWNLPKESMIIAALFHDIGKVGLPGKGSENDYYVEQTDSWRRDKLGELYKHNDNITYLTTADRSVFVLQHYGVRLTVDEWLAIKLNDGFSVQENKVYSLKEPPLVFAVQTADYISTMIEKNVNFWPSGG